MATYETIRNEKRNDAKRVLEGYRALCTLNGQMLKLLEDADSRLLSVTAQMDETRGSGVAKDSMADNIASIHEASAKMRVLSSQYGRRLDEAAHLVGEVIDIDPLAGEVLAIRYMEPGRPPEFAEIAERLGYTEAHVYAKHLDGLDIAADVMNILSIPK